MSSPISKFSSVFVLIAATTLAGCASTPSAESQPALQLASRQQVRLAELAAMMAGSFDSSQQAASDPAFFDIRLHMAPVWPDRADGRWLYVEQAMATMQEKPYRQRVYRLRLADAPATGFVSDVYELPGDPLAYAGAWRNTALLDGLSPEKLTFRDGCSINLIDKGGSFTGATGANSCPSSLRGATYATSEVIITPESLLSWDRGFDSTGKQVWGATAGGYIFVKRQTGSAMPAGVSRQ